MRIGFLQLRGAEPGVLGVLATYRFAVGALVLIIRVEVTYR